MAMNRAIFLDRDGVLCEAIVTNYKPLSARKPDLSDIIIHPNTMKSCKALKEAGYKLLCFTNQPNISRGLISWDTLNAQNELIMKYCFLDDVVVCPHDDKDLCKCRKPLPGMIYYLTYRYNIDLSESFLIGDRWTDTEAGKRAGLKNESIYYINRGYNDPLPIVNCKHVNFMEEAAIDILKREVDSCPI